MRTEKPSTNPEDRFKELEDRILRLLDKAVRTENPRTANLARNCLQTLVTLANLRTPVGSNVIQIEYVNDWRNSPSLETPMSSTQTLPENAVTVKMRLPEN